MSQKKLLKGLTEITLLHKEADQFKLAKLQEQEQALRSNLKDLNAQRCGHSYNVEHGQDAAAIAMADLNWQVWVDQRHRKINSELAQVLAQIEECRAKLRRSFGKDLAANALHQKLHAAQAAKSSRKTPYES